MMANFPNQPNIVPGSYVNSNNAFTSADNVIVHNDHLGVRFPVDQGNNRTTMADIIDIIKHDMPNNGTPQNLPEFLRHLANDGTFGTEDTGMGMINNTNVYFPTADADKPISIDFFDTTGTDQADLKPTNDITGGSDGLSIDASGSFNAPANVDALGGTALRSKLTISDVGQATNWRRVFTWTTQISSVSQGTDRPFFALQRRSNNAEHNFLYFTRLGDNVILRARVQNGDGTQLGITTLQVFNRTGTDVTHHFEQGDIVRFTMEFEKPNPDETDANNVLRVYINAHRFRSSGQYIETIEFSALGVISDSNPDTVNRGRSPGTIDTWNYDTFYFYGGDNGSNYIIPIVGLETWQWVDTATPSDFLTRQQLADRSRTPVSDDHRLLGFYQEVLRNLYIWNVAFRLHQNSEIVAPDGTIHKIVTSETGEVPSPLQQLFSGDFVVPDPSGRAPLVVETGAVIPTTDDDATEYHVFLRLPGQETGIDIGTFTKTTFDGADTLPNRNNNSTNRDSSFLNYKDGVDDEYHFVKGAGNKVDFLAYDTDNSGNDLGGTYTLEINKLSPGGQAHLNFDNTANRTITGKFNFPTGDNRPEIGGSDIATVNRVYTVRQGTGFDELDTVSTSPALPTDWNTYEFLWVSMRNAGGTADWASATHSIADLLASNSTDPFRVGGSTDFTFNQTTRILTTVGTGSGFVSIKLLDYNLVEQNPSA